MERMQIKNKVLYAGRRKVLRVTSLATIESGPFIAADDPIRQLLNAISVQILPIEPERSVSTHSQGPCELFNHDLEVRWVELEQTL